MSENCLYMEIFEDESLIDIMISVLKDESKS